MDLPDNGETVKGAIGNARRFSCNAQSSTVLKLCNPKNNGGLVLEERMNGQQVRMGIEYNPPEVPRQVGNMA